MNKKERKGFAARLVTISCGRGRGWSGSLVRVGMHPAKTKSSRAFDTGLQSYSRGAWNNLTQMLARTRPRNSSWITKQELAFLHVIILLASAQS